MCSHGNFKVKNSVGPCMIKIFMYGCYLLKRKLGYPSSFCQFEIRMTYQFVIKEKVVPPHFEFIVQK